VRDINTLNFRKQFLSYDSDENRYSNDKENQTHQSAMARLAAFQSPKYMVAKNNMGQMYFSLFFMITIFTALTVSLLLKVWNFFSRNEQFYTSCHLGCSFDETVFF
jgi:hypothetical protein